ncbi:MAG: ABC transporter substrate-binding protein [Nitrososphaeria archaeon]
MSQEPKKVGRRTFLNYVIAIVATGVIVGAATYFATPKGIVTVTAPGTTVTKTVTTTITGTPTTSLTTSPTAYPLIPNPSKKWPKIVMAGWEYKSDVVRDNVNIFTNYTGIPAEFIALAEPYEDQMTTKFIGNEPIDICYFRQDVLGAWAEAGWLIPIDDLPTLDIIKDEYIPAVYSMLTYKGKLYGLSYYTDCYAFAYNKAHFEKAGITRPPSTLDEVKQYAIDIKKAVPDILYPIDFPITSFINIVVDTWNRLQIAEGFIPFSEDFEPLFAESDISVYILDWLADVNEKGLLTNILSGSAKESSSLANGLSAMSITTRYAFYEMNITIGGGKKVVGASLLPGKAHNSVCYVRGYGRTKMNKERAQKDKDVEDAMWQILDFFGGKYYIYEGQHVHWVARRWMLEAGLYFAQQPLWKDPKVIETVEKYGYPDIFQEIERKALPEHWKPVPWYREWALYAVPILQDVIYKRRATKEAVKDLARKWNSLKEEWKGSK